MRSVRQRRKRHERGVTMAITTLVMAALLVMTAAGLLFSGTDLRSTENFRWNVEAQYVAESGILNAVKTVNGPGVVNVQAEVVNSWGVVFGNGARNFDQTADFTYTVAPVGTAWDAADAENRATLRATAAGPRQTRTVVVARILRSNVPSTAPGAIYLANDNPTNATFTGNAFLVDGNARNYTGGAGPAPPVPGISTRNATNATETVDSLNAQQKDNVTGLGFNPGPPVVPSVLTSPAAPTQTHLGQIVDELLTRPHVTCNDSVINNSSSCTFGTTNAPQITYINNTNGVTIRGNGNVSGAGILIVEGNLTIQGTLNFKGRCGRPTSRSPSAARRSCSTARRRSRSPTTAAAAGRCRRPSRLPRSRTAGWSPPARTAAREPRHTTRTAAAPAGDRAATVRRPAGAAPA
jgi:hypothetical protein